MRKRILQKEEKHYRKLQIKKYTKVQLSNYAQSLTKTVIVLIEIIKKHFMDEIRKWGYVILI